MTLKLADLETSYGNFSLGPLSLTIRDGVTAVLGPSGAGKSTLLELIAGFETPDSGTITLNGSRIEQTAPENRDVGMVFQDAALFPHLSVEENLRFGAPVRGDIGETTRILEIGDLLDRDPTTLSGGERQRVALARTLVTDPAALLLDEPLSSLDAPIRRRLRLELRDVLAELDIPVVYVTHDQDEAAVVGDRLAVLFDGEMHQEGPVETVFERPVTPAVARFLGMENLIEGRVVDVAEGRTTVDIGPTTLTGVGEPPGNTDRVIVAFRPTAVDFIEDGGNSLTVRIERIVPERDGATVVLEAPELGRLTARVDRDLVDHLEADQRRPVVIDPASVHVLPPENGTRV